MTKIYNQSSETQKRRTLRQQSPEAELRLWFRLRNRQLLGYKFRRQYSVGPYVIDFYCPRLKLAIEVDGDSHFQLGAREYDLKRQNDIESVGIRFLRFTNEEVLQNIEAVVEQIVEACFTHSKSPP